MNRLWFISPTSSVMWLNFHCSFLPYVLFFFKNSVTVKQNLPCVRPPKNMLHALFMPHTYHYVNNRLIPGIRMLGYKCLISDVTVEPQCSDLCMWDKLRMIMIKKKKIKKESNWLFCLWLQEKDSLQGWTIRLALDYWHLEQSHAE